MKLRNSLVSLLRLRLSLERQAWLNLKLMNVRVAAIEERISAVERQIVIQNADRVKKLGQGISSHELQCSLVTGVRLELDQLHAAKMSLVAQHQAVQDEYRLRRSEREILETLLSRRRQELDYEFARREAARVDEGALHRSREKTLEAAEEEREDPNEHNWFRSEGKFEA